MAGCGCGGGAAVAKDMARTLAATFGSDSMTDNGSVMLEYIGPGQGKQSFRHPVSRREYRAGGSAYNRYIIVPPEDVDYLINELRLFRRQAAPAPFVPPPDPSVATNTVAESVAPAPKKREKATA